MRVSQPIGVMHECGRFVECINILYIFTVCFFFFFSSRRRHTRLQGDWSSDVCSSDLQFLREPHGRQHLANLDLLNNRQLLLRLEGKVLLRDSQFLPTLFDDSRIFLDKIRLFDSFWEPLDWCVCM